MHSVTVSAPGKLMLFGEHAVLYGHPCIVTAVDQRMRATLTLLDEPIFECHAPDVGVEAYRKPIAALGTGDIPKGVRFVEIAVKNFLKRHPIMHKGLRIETQSDFASTFGFGSSSASAVCVVKGLSELLVHIPQSEMFDIAFKTVLDVQGKGSGFDVAAAIYGGTLLFRAGGQTIEPIDACGIPLVIGYTGVKADTVTIMNHVKTSMDKQPDAMERLYQSMAELVEPAHDALQREDWRSVGHLMNQNQELLEDLGVSTPKLDVLIDAARNAGAYGAKLSGAGGGDCMIAIADEERRAQVGKAINDAGGQWIDISAGAEGARIDN